MNDRIKERAYISALRQRLAYAESGPVVPNSMPVALEELRVLLAVEARLGRAVEANDAEIARFVRWWHTYSDAKNLAVLTDAEIEVQVDRFRRYEAVLAEQEKEQRQ